MPQTQTELEKQQMKMAELCEATGLSRSTIHYYINIGLLHRPQLVGLNLHLFDETHLNQLRQIRHLRETQGLPLSRIKELLQSLESKQEAGRLHAEFSGDLEVAESSEQGAGPAEDPSLRNKERILDEAIRLFSGKGYEKTKISDITDALHMGKGTFYLYFKNKRELFMECIDRMTVTIVPREAWADIRQEQDLIRKQYKRGVAFLNAFPGFRGILNILRGAMGSDDEVLVQKARDTFKLLTMPMEKDLKRAVADGFVDPQLNAEFMAFLQLIIAEGLGYWLMFNPGETIEQGMDLLVSILKDSFISPDVGPQPGQLSTPVAGEVKDSTGVITRLDNIHFGGHTFLSGTMGEAEIRVDLEKAIGVEVENKGEGLTAVIMLKDGQKIVVKVGEDLVLSGEASFGLFRIPLSKISRIKLK